MKNKNSGSKSQLNKSSDEDSVNEEYEASEQIRIAKKAKLAAKEATKKRDDSKKRKKNAMPIDEMAPRPCTFPSDTECYID